MMAALAFYVSNDPGADAYLPAAVENLHTFLQTWGHDPARGVWYARPGFPKPWLIAVVCDAQMREVA